MEEETQAENEQTEEQENISEKEKSTAEAEESTDVTEIEEKSQVQIPVTDEETENEVTDSEVKTEPSAHETSQVGDEGKEDKDVDEKAEKETEEDEDQVTQKKATKKGPIGEGTTEKLSPLGPIISSLCATTISDEDEEEEDEELEKEEAAEPIDRDSFIEEYKMLITQQFATKRKNMFLQYKLVNYFKKRKMDHVFRDEELDEDMQTRYEKKLEDFFTIRERGFREQTAELADISHMEDLCQEQAERSEKNFKAMQTREKEIAKGLIDTRTGKAISEKQVERLISRQQVKWAEISEIRLNFIKKKEKLKGLEMQLRALETIDGKLHLIDYEQLRMENQNSADKIEEREEELARLRTRYNVAVQALAHVREKSFIIDQNIEDLLQECRYIEDDVTASRERVNDFKIRRDTNRSETNKLKSRSGLLTHTRLLNDMENSLEEVNKTREELALLKETHKENRHKLDGIRRTIEQYTETQPKEFGTSIKPGHSATSLKTNKVYRGRPSLMIPAISKVRIM